MPDQVDAVEDTLADGETQTAIAQDGSAPVNTETAQTKLILGKYKSVEEAEKGIAEEQKLFGKQAEELGKLRQEVARLQEQSSLKDVLTAIAANKTQREEPAIDMETFVSQLGEKWHDDGKEVSKQLLGVTQQWITKVKQEAKSEVESLRDEINRLKADTAEKMERINPFYQEHKDVIDKMVGKGVPLRTAIDLVRELAGDSAVSTPVQRTPPPASVVPTRTIANESNKPAPAYLYDMKSVDPVLQAEFPEKSDKELMELAASLNAQRLDRVKNGQPIVDKSFKPMAGRR